MALLLVYSGPAHVTHFRYLLMEITDIVFPGSEASI